MSKYSLFHPLLLSFFSNNFYRDIASTWRGRSFLFLVVLLSACWIPASIGVHRAWARFAEGPGKAIVEQIPTIEIKNGYAWVDAEQPYYIRSGADDSASFILDTTGQVNSLEDTDARMLLTRDKLITKQDDTRTQIISLSGISQFSITQDAARHWLSLARRYASSLAFLIFLLGSACFRIAQACVFALLGIPLAKHLHAAIGYPSLLSVAVVSLTPTILIKTFLELLGVQFPFSWLVYLAISGAYFAFAVSANSPHDHTEVQMASRSNV